VRTVFFTQLGDFLALLWGEERPDLEHSLQTVLLCFDLESPYLFSLFKDGFFGRSILLKQLSHLAVRLV
jgi:hypothetical protein